MGPAPAHLSYGLKVTLPPTACPRPGMQFNSLQCATINVLQQEAEEQAAVQRGEYQRVTAALRLPIVWPCTVSLSRHTSLSHMVRHARFPSLTGGRLMDDPKGRARGPAPSGPLEDARKLALALQRDADQRRGICREHSRTQKGRHADPYGIAWQPNQPRCAGASLACCRFSGFARAPHRLQWTGRSAPRLPCGRTAMSTDQPPIQQVDPDQDRGTLSKVASDVRTILTPNEEILYIALQNVTALSMKKDSAIATNNRLIFHRPAMFGRVNFADYQWEDVKNVTMKEGMMAAELIAEMVDGRIDRVGGLDKSQIRRLYSICQQKELEWREKRRLRDLEEARARSGGFHMATPQAQTNAPTEDPVEKLAKAKAMLDQNLISEAEYETLKAKIIASF
jgi:hypothetical protein